MRLRPKSPPFLHHRNRGRSGISFTVQPSGNFIFLNSDPTPIARELRQAQPGATLALKQLPNRRGTPILAA